MVRTGKNVRIPDSNIVESDQIGVEGLEQCYASINRYASIFVLRANV